MLGRFRQVASGAVKRHRQNRPALIISVGLCILSVALYWGVYFSPHPNAFLQFLDNIELKTLDVRFQLRPARAPGSAVVIVAIDQKSEDVLGRWPFPRSYFAQAVNFLRDARARVIAFDMNFPQPDANSALEALRAVREDYSHIVAGPSHAPAFESRLESREAAADNDKQFAAALSHFENIILGYYTISPEAAKAQNQDRLKQFTDILFFQQYPQVVHPEYVKNSDIPEDSDISPNLPEFASSAKNFGFMDIVPDSDGIVRREPAVLSIQGNLYPSLDVAAALAYTNNSLDQVKVVLSPRGVREIDMGQRVIPTDPGGFVQLDYVGATGSFPVYSLADIVEHRLSPEAFRDRLVLIGPTVPGISGTAITPFPQQQFPGVEVHANMIDDILYQHFIRRGTHEKLIDVGFIILFSLGAGLLFSVLNPLRATIYLSGSLFCYFWFTYYLFAHSRMWIADFLPMSTLFVTYAGIVSYRFFFEEGEKKKVRSAFSQYMHPGLISLMLNSPEMLRLGGEEKELTALFADIRGFTTLSESLTPTQLVELLNEYFSEMVEVIFKNWGTLDKYIGDAIMAFWGAPYPQPDHALRACQAALEMQEALQRLQASWESRKVPRIDIGVGINSGHMLVGNMGSERRKNYTVMGDDVNLASRLEGLNRQFGTRLIISEATLIHVRDQVVARELDFIRVKGKMQPVKVFELLGLAADAPRHLDLVSRFAKGIEAYRSGQWQTAIEVLEDLLRDYPSDGPSQTFIKRCHDLLAQPPDVWDGVYVMKSK